MSRLTDLIAQAKTRDPQLGADLDGEFKQLSSRLPFGLNFERYSPEAVELPQRPIRKGGPQRWQGAEQLRCHRIGSAALMAGAGIAFGRSRAGHLQRGDRVTLQGAPS